MNSGNPQARWADVTELRFDRLGTVIDGRAGPGRPTVQVPVTGVLDRVEPGMTGGRADWANETRPSKDGWNKLVAVRECTIEARLPA